MEERQHVAEFTPSPSLSLSPGDGQEERSDDSDYLAVVLLCGCVVAGQSFFAGTARCMSKKLSLH